MRMIGTLVFIALVVWAEVFYPSWVGLPEWMMWLPIGLGLILVHSCVHKEDTGKRCVNKEKKVG